MSLVWAWNGHELLCGLRRSGVFERKVALRRDTGTLNPISISRMV